MRAVNLEGVQYDGGCPEYTFDLSYILMQGIKDVNWFIVPSCQIRVRDSKSECNAG